MVFRAVLLLVFAVCAASPGRADFYLIGGGSGHHEATAQALCDYWVGQDNIHFPANTYAFAGIEPTASAGACKERVTTISGTHYQISPFGIYCATGYVDLYSDSGCVSSALAAMVDKLIGWLSANQAACACSASTNSHNPRQEVEATTSANSAVGNRGNKPTGDPIDIGTGNVFYQRTDYTTAGPNRLAFTRYYNSRDMFSGTLSTNWHSNFDGLIIEVTSSSVIVIRPSGQRLSFNLIGGTWKADTDVDYTLTATRTTYTLHAPDDSVETYKASAISLTKYILSSIQMRDGYTETLTYNSMEQLTSVSDSYSRSLSFTYTGDLLTQLTTPDSTSITFGYDSTPLLTSVTYSTSPTQTIGYAYGLYAPFNALTSITDESGNVSNSFSYDSNGRGLTSQSYSNSTYYTLGLTSVSYNDTTGARTVTNPLGVQDTYSFSTLQNAPKITQISRASTATTAAATMTFSYDTNGYLASAIDWNGNTTAYTNNSHGLPTQIVEASGSGVARTTTVTYDTTWTRQPASIATPGVTASFTYDSDGNTLTRTLTDTTTTSTPYSTSGQTRTWTYTYDATGEVLTVKNPRNKTTTLTYSSGALASVTDALSHATNISSATGGGRPLTISDPNSVGTTLTYDARQRLTSSAVSTTGGTLTTSYTLYPNGETNKVTLPDGSYLQNTFNYETPSLSAVFTVTDPIGNRIKYTLDNLRNPVETQIYDSGTTVYFDRTATYDALGRKTADTSTVTSLSTTYTYDKNGNALTITDPNSNTTTQTFDALNRLSTVTDANSGVTTITYDAHDRPLTVTDALSHVTSYVYDGFRDRIQVTSPDSGTTVYVYDANGNLTQQTDAGSVVTNFTYDDTDRMLTTSYPADSSLNVSYTYDQTGHGKGIGRLTSLTDAAGSDSFTYDERGNRLSETRVTNETTPRTFVTSYTYDGASRIASTTYPSGAVSSNTRISDGEITAMPFSATGADASYTVTGVNRYPFGQWSLVTFNNGTTGNYVRDKDYFLTYLAHALPGYVGSFVNWNLTNDGNGNITYIQDNISSSNSQTLGYDVLNRLTSASSTGLYGTQGWTYDKVGNRLTDAASSSTNHYTSGTSQLASISVGGSTTVSYGYTAQGNINSITPTGSTATTFTYNKANRVASITPAIGTYSTYAYDYAGQRIFKIQSGSPNSVYLYGQSGELLEEINNGVATDYMYLDGVQIANWQPSQGHVYFAHTDQRGAPVAMTDEYALVNWAGWYAPFGSFTQTTSTGTMTGPVTQNVYFPGQELDGANGFEFNGARVYASGIGRYLQTDPIGLAGGVNTYAYVAGNPIGLIDPRGLAIGDMPSAPPGYDPKTWSSGTGRGGKTWIKDPRTGNTYWSHPEDEGHWRHWDIEGPNGEDLGRCPEKSVKPWPNQKKAPYGDQSGLDPSGEAPAVEPLPVPLGTPLPFWYPAFGPPPSVILPIIVVPGLDKIFWPTEGSSVI